jgi:LPS export ABC transporter protein LptC
MTKIPKKYLPIAGILVLFLIIGYFLSRIGDKGINNTVISLSPPEAGLTGKKLHFVEDNPDKGTKYILDADEAIYSQGKQQVTLNNVRLKLEPLDSPSLEIKGREGDYDENLQEIKLKGDIQGYSTNEYRISTEEITYKQKDGFLKTNEPVKITGPFFSVSGIGLIFYPEKETFKIISHVTTILEWKEGL